MRNSNLKPYFSRLCEPNEDQEINHDSVAIVRFVHHQVLEQEHLGFLDHYFLELTASPKTFICLELFHGGKFLSLNLNIIYSLIPISTS